MKVILLCEKTFLMNRLIVMDNVSGIADNCKKFAEF